MPSHTAHRPSRRLGQNFLVDSRIAEEIVSNVSPNPNDTVLEPGPGHGKLTRLLQKKAGKVIAVEKDPHLASELRETFAKATNITILEGDVLEMEEGLPSFNKVVTTPPYYLSSKLVLWLASREFDLCSIVFQKEFGDRLLASPGTSDYGRLTVAAQRKLDLEKIRVIPRTAFSPRPKVDSVLLKVRRKRVVTELDERLFEELVRGVFNQRRRLLKSSLRHFLTLKYGRDEARNLLEKIEISEDRVYELSISQLENLSLQLWRVLSDRLASGSVSAHAKVNHI